MRASADSVPLAYKGMGWLPDWALYGVILLVCVWMVVVAIRRNRS
ncbi:hypothetical protein [Streptomyces swartbergensis]|nr:hypothetical protein [Streptomyces swartbergensis]